MQWLKLKDGALFNLDCVTFIDVRGDTDYIFMRTNDGASDWHPDAILQVWAALQEPNTVCGQSHAAQLMNITPRERLCNGCGKRINATDVYYEMVHGVYHADCVPKKP